jgi:serine/threonine protein kinase
MLGRDNAWKPHAPAIFYEYCPLGDIVTHCKNLIRSLEFIPEHTLWKLFTDMAKALVFIHNCQEIPILHCDINSDNILVVDGPLLRFDKKITSLPILKLADFSRSKEYRPQFAKYEDGSKCYWGTWSYAPPWEEQYRYQTPAADIWSLGATLQFFATGKEPVMATAEFIQYMKVEGLLQSESHAYYQGAGRRPSDEVVRALAHCLSTFDGCRVQSRVEQMVFNVPGEGSFKANHIERVG